MGFQLQTKVESNNKDIRKTEIIINVTIIRGVLLESRTVLAHLDMRYPRHPHLGFCNTETSNIDRLT